MCYLEAESLSVTIVVTVIVRSEPTILDIASPTAVSIVRVFHSEPLSIVGYTDALEHCYEPAVKKKIGLRLRFSFVLKSFSGQNRY